MHVYGGSSDVNQKIFPQESWNTLISIRTLLRRIQFQWEISKETSHCVRHQNDLESTRMGNLRGTRLLQCFPREYRLRRNSHRASGIRPQWSDVYFPLGVTLSHQNLPSSANFYVQRNHFTLIQLLPGLQSYFFL